MSASAPRRARRALALCLALAAWQAASARAAFEFSVAPKLPVLTAVKLGGAPQTVDSTMSVFAVIDTRGTKSGWNITAQGQSGTGKSAVFKQYCPKAKCGSEAEGYVTGGHALPANSLKLNSTGGSFKGGTGSAPALQCSTGCNLDSSTAVKVVSAATGGAGEGTWTVSGLGASSLQLALASTVYALPSEEVYAVNVLWTLSTGP